MSIQVSKTEFARKMRNNPTTAEKAFHEQIKGGRIAGVRFYRQTNICGWIVDFYAPSLKLIIEIDGKSHQVKQIIEQDALKDTTWRGLGYNVMRFTNEQAITRDPIIKRQIEKLANEWQGARCRCCCQIDYVTHYCRGLISEGIFEHPFYALAREIRDLNNAIGCQDEFLVQLSARNVQSAAVKLADAGISHNSFNLFHKLNVCDYLNLVGDLLKESN